MRKLLCLIGLGMIIGLPAAQAKDIEGLWLTQNKRSVVQIASCNGDKLCGHIYWITEGGMQFDTKNPDESKREIPMCGLKILWGMTKDNDKRWEDGKIYKADDGDIYDAYIELKDDDTLKLRGFMGVSILGKTQYWTKVSADQYMQCRTP